CYSYCELFFFPFNAIHHHLHSFPTRRSSDLFSSTGMRKMSGIGWPSAVMPTAPTRVRLASRAVLRTASSAAIQPPSEVPTRCTRDRKSTRLNSSHDQISYAVFCLKKKKKKRI